MLRDCWVGNQADSGYWRYVIPGLGQVKWGEYIAALRHNGYDGVLSIEHEDSLMTPREGLEKAIRFLQSIVLTEPKGKVTWA